MHDYKKVTLDYLETAPKKMVFEMELPVSCETLFGIFERRDTWQWAGIEDVLWDSEPPFHKDTKRTIVQPSGNKLDEQFLVWEQDRRMVFRIDQGDLSLLGALLEDYTVTPVTDASCRFTWTVAYELRGWRAVFSPVLGAVLKGVFGKMFKDFEKLVPELAAEEAVQSAT